MTIYTGWWPQPTQRERIMNMIAQLPREYVELCAKCITDDQFEANLAAAVIEYKAAQIVYLNHLAASIDGGDIDDHNDALLRANQTKGK